MKRSLFWLLDQYPETGELVAAVHEAALEQAVEADRRGFSSLWVSEHHFVTLGTAPNPAVLLAAIAQRTERLRIGPATTVLPLRNPIHVAEDYALVDVLSGGRLNLGVGSGSRAAEYEPFGIDFERRRELYAENLAEIRRRWSAAANGDIGVNSLNVAPVQSPAPPVYVATMNDEAAYRIGLAGDSMLTLVPPPEPDLDGPLKRLREHASGLEEVRDGDQRAESVMMMFAHVAQTKEEVRATVVPALARLMRAMTGAEWPDPEALYEQMRRSGVGLFGEPEEVDYQLQRLADLGANHIAFISRFGGMPKEVAARSLRHLAPNTVCESSRVQCSLTSEPSPQHSSSGDRR